MKLKNLLIILLVGLFLFGCSKNNKISNNTNSTNTTSTYANPLPNVGKVEIIKVIAKGQGDTLNEAINNAVKNALLQEYGEKVNIDSVTYKEALHVADNFKTRDISTELSGSAIENQTNGVLKYLKIIKTKSPSFLGIFGRKYVATIEVGLPKFIGPQTSSKVLKIVIGPIQTNTNSFIIGDQKVPASKIVSDIHQMLVTALTQTNRFMVLDRSFGNAINKELSLIAEGQTPSEDYAKLGQVTSADIIWVGSINNFDYYKNARNLSISNRQLVSYSGGWSISERLVNVATRQIIAADTVQGAPQSIAPTTLGTNFNASNTIQSMENNIVKKILSSIIIRIYPITVVQKNGDQVVLSQGGESLQTGAVYQIVALGQEIRDPQTGSILGRTQTPFGKVVIDRVTPTLSYGHLIGVNSSNNIQPGELQISNLVANSYQSPSQKSITTPTQATVRKTLAPSQTYNNNQRRSHDNNW